MAPFSPSRLAMARECGQSRNATVSDAQCFRLTGLSHNDCARRTSRGSGVGQIDNNCGGRAGAQLERRQWRTRKRKRKRKRKEKTTGRRWMRRAPTFHTVESDGLVIGEQRNSECFCKDEQAINTFKRPCNAPRCFPRSPLLEP